MTGFGVGDAPLGDGRVMVELRALNHRFLDVRVRLPEELSDQSFFVEQLAREGLARGRFDVGVRLEGAALPPPRFSIERARALYRGLSMLRDELAPGTELPVTALTAMPDLVTTPTTADSEGARAALKAAFDAALLKLDEMRRQEGEALNRELSARLNSARKLRVTISQRGSEMLDAYRTRLRERLDRLLSETGLQMDAARLETEIVILADRSDVTEELVRLDSHFDQFARLLTSDGPVGRRLDFLLQEIGRESNTIGAKSQDAPIAHLVVEMKAELERIREQVQNVE
ncbi:MAG: YicC/YloC family endoribonuclease [Pseudomonadota bacterium]